jgi:uncharacterized SAM-binding protein YcdF (DUF218 family)
MIKLLINPTFILIVLYVLGWYFKKRHQRKIGRYIHYFTLLWLLLIFVSPLPQYLLYNLEYKHPVIDLSQLDTTRRTHIIVLGGGSNIAPELPYSAQLSQNALGRLVEGLRIYHQLDRRRLVLSGHSASGRTSVAEMMALTALDLQIPTKDTLMVTTPGNTREEARHYAQRFGTERQIILVTSASHMPRAVGEFAKVGIEVIPAPCNFEIKRDPETKFYNFKPSLRKINMMNIAMKEYIGYWYMQTGRTMDYNIEDDDGGIE